MGFRDGCSEIMVLPSAGLSQFIVVDNDAVSDCGVYPYDDTCGTLDYDDDLNAEETVPYVYTRVVGSIGEEDVFRSRAVMVPPTGLRIGT